MSDKPKKAKYILSDVDVKEVSLVGKPAIGRTYLLTKAADDQPVEITAEESTATLTLTEEAGTAPAEGVNTMNEKLVELLKEVELSDEAREALNTVFGAEVPVEIMKGFYELAGYEVPEKVVEKEVIVEKEVEKIVEVEKTAEPEDPKEAALKSMSEEALTIFKEMETKLAEAEAEKEEARKAAEKAEEERVNKEYIQKATEEFGELGLSAEELGPALKSLEEKLDEAELKVVMTVFNTAKGTIELTEQDKEVGTGADTTVNKEASNDPEYIRKAQEMVEKGEANTVEQAVAELARTTPELFLVEE